MKAAIMQPYFFPYFGYYQLVNLVDTFVFLDDVNYINKGWVDRNKIISNGQEFYFSVPLNKKSQNKLINEIYLADSFLPWRNKFLKTLKHLYGKCLGFEKIYDLVKKVLFSEDEKISDLACCSIQETSCFLGSKTQFLYSSDLSCTGGSQERIINICKLLGVTEYVNPIGGLELYDKKNFLEHDIKLNFMRSMQPFDYLSIIHVLMKDKKQIDLDKFVLE